MQVLYITPQPYEVLRQRGWPETSYSQWMLNALSILFNQLRTVNATSDALPTFDGVDAVVIGGSSLSVYDGYLWQDKLEDWIREAVAGGIPFLGICYGYQALIKAFGGIVERDPLGREIGLTKISLTQLGLQHPLFQGLPNTLTLCTSHADSVMLLPPDFTLLATNPRYFVQVVAKGKKVVGIQAHPEYPAEVELKMLRVRERELIETGRIENQEKMNTLIKDIKKADELVTSTGRSILRNFLENIVAKQSL